MDGHWSNITGLMHFMFHETAKTTLYNTYEVKSYIIRNQRQI
jgi:hypothetical protein